MGNRLSSYLYSNNITVIIRIDQIEYHQTLPSHTKLSYILENLNKFRQHPFTIIETSDGYQPSLNLTLQQLKRSEPIVLVVKI